MTQTSRERVTRCLNFDHPDRMPRDLWVLPWASNKFPEDLERIGKRFPNDMDGAPNVHRPSPRTKGDWYKVGEYTDDWGCRFVNIQEGVHGEVQEPILPDIADWKSIRPPYETLPENPAAARDEVNRACEASDRFMRAGCCPRPWERYQFIRGTENSMVDVMMPEDGVLDLLRAIHEFHLREVEFWITTDVDAITCMDDWGSQTQLLIPPPVWKELFKPMYRDYADLAHGAGKTMFMHSDGHISEIYEDLVDVGIDCLNSQLFCMDMADLERRVKGKITFWGEIDRQHVLSAPDPQVGRDAVRKVARHLYDPAGGIIAQFEMGPGCNPATAEAIFEEWEAVEQEHGIPQACPGDR